MKQVLSSKVFKRALLYISLCFILTFSACGIYEQSYVVREKNYYKEKRNFVTVEAVFKGTEDNSRVNYLIIWTEKGQTTEIFSEWRFKFTEASSLRLKNASFLEEVVPGDTITFIAAPKYFGDGYLVPIVGISANGKTYLDFETGWRDLMEEYD